MKKMTQEMVCRFESGANDSGVQYESTLFGFGSKCQKSQDASCFAVFWK